LAQLHKSAATLRIAGDDLVPQEISNLLGGTPTLARTKGETIIGPKTGKTRIARTGQWHLDANDREPEDLNGQISEILGQITGDLEVWRLLSQKYEIDLFCGWFMKEGGEGLEVSAESLAALGDRGIKLGVCLYAPTAEDYVRSDPRLAFRE